MTYSFADRLDRLGARKQQVDSREVIYERPTLGSVPLTATVSEQRPEDLLEAGLGLEIKRRDYLIDTAALVIEGVPVEPEPGDQIIDGEFTCRIVPAEGNETFRYTTQSRLRMRIHTEVTAKGKG